MAIRNQVTSGELERLEGRINTELAALRAEIAELKKLVKKAPADKAEKSEERKANA